MSPPPFLEVAPFWGPVTSTIDWCEPNYQATRFIAEPLNTFSNLSFVIFGLLGAIHEIQQCAKRSYVILHSTIACIGIGSMLFHGTLTTLGQQLDELPMVWHLLMAMYCVNRDAVGTDVQAKRIVTSLLLVYAVVFSVLHVMLKTTTAFQVHFGALLGLCLIRMYTRFRKVDPGENGKQIITLFASSGLAAFGFWLLDYHACDWVSQLPINPQGHSMWHLCMGYSAFCSVVMLKIYESAESGKAMEIKYWPFVSFGLPFAYRANGVKGVLHDDMESNTGIIGGRELF